MIYLDYAAATPIDEKVLVAMTPYFREQFFNPSASYLPARQVRADLDQARHSIAQIIGARPAEIVFTAGATESINLALAGMNGAILTTAIEHPAVLETAKSRGGKVLPVDKKGRIDLNNLEKELTDNVEIVSIGYANNEIGTVQPLKEIAAIISKVKEDRRERSVKTPLLFHSDASQAAGILDLNVARLGIDLLTLNAGKFYGPKQVGLLFVRAGVELKPLIRGGGQEMGLRSGTENVAGAIGLAKALEIAEKHRGSEVKRSQTLRDDLEKFLADEFPEIKINGDKKHRLPNLTNFFLPGLDGERAVFALDERGVMVATGSACAANKGTRSHVLTAIGLDEDLADGSLRISLGRPTTTDEIEEVKKILMGVLHEQRKFS
ncbi:cysteine desulfurase [Candidatus Saccharibacteria bacterium]|nr:cysteine desulfurase [Candidatus Saccharibacteria bacterium]